MTIVIFGAAVLPDGKPSGALRRRVETALAQARGQTDTWFIPSGGIGRHGPSEASVMASVLRESGVPDNRILLEETARDTLSSVLAVKQLIRREGLAGPVLAATSAYHLPRCLLLLCLAGMAARPCPPTRAPAAARFWKRWYWRLREIPAIPYDTILILWHRMNGRI